VLQAVLVHFHDAIMLSVFVAQRCFVHIGLLVEKYLCVISDEAFLSHHIMVSLTLALV
jgi:hypothetical protein